MKVTKRQLKKIIREDRAQEIVKLVSTRIPEVGFGEMDEEDFDAVKVELEDDGLADEQELSQLSFQKWQDLKEGHSVMKITKRQLKRIIKEEKRKLVNENVWTRGESASALLAFGRAYASLGSKVQEQVDAVVDAYLGGGAREWDANQHFLEVVYEQNPNAIEMAHNTLRQPLQALDGQDAEDVLDALDEAMNAFNSGDGAGGDP